MMSEIRATDVLGCPYKREANHMANVLVNEVSRASTWADKQDAIWAIQQVRMEEKHLVAEWEHLNNPSPEDQCEDLPTDIGGYVPPEEE